MRATTVFRHTLLIILSLVAIQARAELSQKQARKLIARAAGLDLPTKAVKVEKIRQVSPAVAEATAEIEMAFRLTRNENGKWLLSEIRGGQDKWEDLETIARAGRLEAARGNCDSSNVSSSGEASVKLARCLVANLFGVHLPSDAVRVKEISSLSLGSRPSALAVALVQVDVRLGNDNGGWRVVDFRTNGRDWVNLEGLPDAVNRLKRTQATRELDSIAKALAAFRKDRGFYVISDKHSVLIDHLSPHYLSTVIRLDPWHKPYEYLGERDRFSLRSAGPDGKPNTADDIVVTNSSR